MVFRRTNNEIECFFSCCKLRSKPVVVVPSKREKIYLVGGEGAQASVERYPYKADLR